MVLGPRRPVWGWRVWQEAAPWLLAWVLSAYKADSITQTIGFDGDGGFAQTSRRESRQRALFGGTARRTVDMESTEESIEAADRFWEQISSAMQDAAKKLGVETYNVIGAAFTSTTKLNKKGEAKDTISYGTLLGERFDEDFEQFAQRVQGANILSVIAEALTPEQIGGVLTNVFETGLDIAEESVNPGGSTGLGIHGDGGPLMWEKVAKDIDDGIPIVDQASENWSQSFSGLMSIAERWSSTGEEFLEGANFLLAAAIDIVDGFGLLGDDGTLEQIADLVTQFQTDGESLVDTYVRIKASIVAVENGLSNFGVMMNRTRLEFVEFSTELVESLGGLENATTMFESIQTAFGDMAQFDSVAGDSSRDRRSTMLEGLGLDPDILAADFIVQFQEAMSSGIEGTDAADWVTVA